MGHLLPCIRCVVAVCNICFLITAILFITFGLILQFGNNVLEDRINEALKPVRTSVKNTYGQENANQITADEIDLEAILKPVIVLVLVFGFTLLLLCCLGMIGACLQKRWMLIVYATIITVLVIGQIIFIALVLGEPDPLKKSLKKRLDKTIKEYRGLNGTDVKSISWNYAMERFSCCGVDGYTDFSGSSWLLKSSHITPWACCKDLPDNQGEADDCAGASSSAALSTIAGKNNYDKGCMDEVYDTVIKQNAVYIGLVAFFLFVLQVVLVILSCVMANDDSNKTHPEGNRRKENRRPTQGPSW